MPPPPLLYPHRAPGDVSYGADCFIPVRSVHVSTKLSGRLTRRRALNHEQTSFTLPVCCCARVGLNRLLPKLF